MVNTEYIQKFVNWFLTFTIGGITFSVVLGYILRQVFENGLRKDLERYKGEILKVLKENEIQYSLIQKTRVEVISKVYPMILDFEESAKKVLADYRTCDIVTKEMKESRRDLDVRFDELLKYFRYNKLYFDNSVGGMIAQFASNINIASFWFDGAEKDQKEAIKIIYDDLPKLRQLLESEFRSILGVESK